jgi:Cysteine-rich CPXCG
MGLAIIGQWKFRLAARVPAARVRHNCRMETGFQCAGCGEWNSTTLDESAGRRQSYVEDCQICCRPNVLRVEYDTVSQEFFIAAALE